MSKKILFVIPSFVGGGAEQVLLGILKCLDRGRYEPVVAVFSRENNFGAFPEDIRTVLIEKRSRWDFLRIIKGLANIIYEEMPSLVYSDMTYTNIVSVLAVMLSHGKARLCISEHNNFSLDVKGQGFRALKKFLVRRLYPRADVIHFISKGVKQDFTENYGVPAGKSVIINNPVDIARINRFVSEETEEPWFREDTPVIAACGRLTEQKNYPLLLRAFKMVLKKTEARLIILGQGELENTLRAYVSELGISAGVKFLGFKTNPYKYMGRARALALSSSWEGFGNVLLEAMACGTPVISTRCPYGPEEIITDNINGLLVPVGDEEAMADAILRLLTDEALRSKLAEAGKNRAGEFKTEHILEEYYKIFEGD
ncbi:MAG: glycosyltransferase [Nitrospirota bacterium]